MSEIDSALNPGGDDEAATAAAEAEATAAAEATATAEAEATAAAAAEANKDYWPNDWQEKSAKGDEKRAALLARYGSPDAAFDALDAAQTRIRSGELLPAMPDDPTKDELKEWRKSRGLPEEPSGYDHGIEIDAADKDIIESLLVSAHGANLQPDQVKETIKWYHETKAAQAEVRQELDATQRDEAVGALNQEWGENYRRNQNLVKGFLNRMFPKEVRLALEGGRFADGRGFFNNPDMMRSLLAVELELNPVGIVPPGGSGDITQGLDDEIAEIKKWMGSPRKSAEGKKYWDDQKVQKRYRDLIEQRDKTNAA